MVFQIQPGDPASPVILHVPHASRVLSPAAGLLLGDATLADELDHLTDSYTDLIAQRAADLAAVRPWVFGNLFSRLVVDPERFPDDREEMRAVGMGAVYTHGYAGRELRDDDPVRDEHLLHTHYRPYAAAVADLVASRLTATGRAIIVDVHSYPEVALPYELRGDGPRPPVCLGTDDFHTPPALVNAAAVAFAGFDPLRDTPFAGCYVPLRYYGRERAVTARRAPGAAGRPRRRGSFRRLPRTRPRSWRPRRRLARRRCRPTPPRPGRPAWAVARARRSGLRRPAWPRAARFCHGLVLVARHLSRMVHAGGGRAPGPPDRLVRAVTRR